MPTTSPLPLEPTLAAGLQAPEPGLRIGVDTHADVHVAAAIDELGRLRATISVPTTLAGLQRLHTWARQLGRSSPGASRAPAATAPALPGCERPWRDGG
jgi:hypothetical protein